MTLNITAYVGTPPPAVAHGWFYDYQTIIASGVALCAALIAAEISRRQLRSSREQLVEMRRQADRDRAGRLRAARASLPAVLSAICDYAETTARTLNGAWPAAAALYPDDANPLAAYRVTLAIAPFPSATLESLERIVALTDSDGVAERIESILREAQVLGARTRKLTTGDEVRTSMLAVYILQAASMYARAESLFEYARHQADGVAAQPLWERTFTALDIFDVSRREVIDMARRERDNGDPPGEADTRGVY
ncbi:hypothetical protein GCM10008023_19860 [Sphingomonas glacialis]|uniref:DUF4760 domain-containing protein n=1 Tax=Sphingomonas glacialis TaxID=658225 RepID=A0ABQ3LKX1_9SPHN|nr:hypothetical protein [Sphingomonas glacialis]GHH16167.1 hypothetical protein GCM10008023_19860 [Sphingomonas glacialis]